MLKQMMIGGFLLVAGVYTMTLNSWNAQKFSLQNATVASLVQKKSFALYDQIIPEFNLVEGSETFRFGQEIYPMKQPGQTILGAMIYSLLYRLGINFVNHFHYTSHLITLGTSTLMMAAATTVIFYLAYQMSKQMRVAIWVSIVFAFGTIVWPYAGVSHHDIYGLFWGIMAFGCYYLARELHRPHYYLGAGFFSTLMLFFTMLPLSFPLVLWGVTLLSRQFEAMKKLSWGMMLGILPTFVFNYTIFGKFWLVPNLAGKVADTMPVWSWINFVDKLQFYLSDRTTSLLVFSPVLIFGIAGILMIPRGKVWLKQLLFFIPLSQLIHISLMETSGGYQYGPRYLLIILPYLTLGIAYWLKKRQAGLEEVVFWLTLTYSVGVALLGAVRTVMYEVPGPYAPGVFLQELIHNEGPDFRMLLPGAVMVAMAGVWFYKLKQEEVRGKVKR